MDEHPSTPPPFSPPPLTPPPFIPPPSTPPPVHSTTVSLFIRACGNTPSTGVKGNVVLEFLCSETSPFWIFLPFTQEEVTRTYKNVRPGSHWELTWTLIKAWPGASFLSDKQWVLLASLCRTLFWFATDKNDATAAALPAFIRSYLLLGEVGRHFRKNITVNGTVLLHLLVIWAQEHVPNAFILPQPAFDLPDEVQHRVDGKVV